MQRMTEEQARDLLSHIDGLAEKVDVAEEQTRRTRRITRALAVVIAALVAGGLMQWWLINDLNGTQEDMQASRVQQCENGNATRAGQREIWEFFFEVTTAANQQAPRAVLEFYDAYVRWITEDVLPPRDCSDLSREYPQPAPPPSYERALQEALAEQQAGD